MDVKLKTSQQLLQKLAHGCGDAQLHAVAEIRLFSKWDDANRVSLVQAGAIAPLLTLVEDTGTNVRVQENAMAALLNMSINTEINSRLANEAGVFDAVLRHAGADAGSRELRAIAAGLLYSLLLCDDVKQSIGRKETVLQTLVGLLRDGSSKCRGEALKAFFLLAKMDEPMKEILLQEKYELITLLLFLLKAGKEKLTEDCLAVLAVLASCRTGAKALSQGEASAVPMLVYLINSESAKTQENAVAVVLNMCRHDEEAKQALPLQTLIPVLKSLQGGGSDRGRGKAEALLKVLEHDGLLYGSWDEYSASSCILGDIASTPSGSTRDLHMQSSMPVMNPHGIINYSPPPRRPKPPNSAIPSLRLQPPQPSSPSSPMPSSKKAAFFNNKYVNLAKNLFTRKHRKNDSYMPLAS